ncbi:MAG: hypothetical protein R8G66_34845 [Cytophagales bacterium]|nr:hypothetical protein [Cytophagales bacterium]
MMKARLLLKISFFLLALGAQSQDVKERLYFKIGVGNSFGLSATQLDFPVGSNGVFEENYRPGGGYNLYFGIGVPLNTDLDLEVTLEQTMQLSFTQTASTGGFGSSSASTFQSFFRTSLNVGAYFNLPELNNGANFRIGGGGFYTVPSKGTFRSDGETWGTFRLQSGPGLLFGASLSAPVEKVILEPGLRVKIANLDVKENNFDDPNNQITSGNISSIDILFAILF